MPGACVGALLTAACALLAPACTARVNPLDSEQLVSVRASLERALQRDELDTALELARAYERRVPGPDSRGALARVLWRMGDLLQAEALFRRSAAGGDPDGRLGLARALASRGQYAQARELATPLLEVTSVRRGAARLLAALAWASANARATAEYLRIAAGDAGQQSLAEAVAGAAADGGWWGGQTQLRLEQAEGVPPTLAARIAGRNVRLALALEQPISWVSAEVARAAGGATGALAVADVELSPALRYRNALLQVRAPDERQAAHGIDGALAFDLLSRAVWEVDVGAGRLVVAPPGGAERDLEQPPLRRTHWLQARVVRDGVAAQLLTMPRVDARVVSAAIDLGVRTALEERVARSWLRPGQSLPAGPVVREVRFGAWREGLPVAVADLLPRARGGAVAPQAVLGRDLLGRWRVRWMPARRELSLRPSVQ